MADEQIVMLTNEQATAGNIYGGLDWMLGTSYWMPLVSSILSQFVVSRITP